jgi:hypothetical protein
MTNHDIYILIHLTHNFPMFYKNNDRIAITVPLTAIRPITVSEG